MERLPMETAMSTDLVVDMVMRHLNVEDLLSCRKVSKLWNKEASSVLRRRSTMIRSISNEKELLALEKCMKQSRDFPFAGLIFDDPKKLNSPGAMKFFQNYGAKFTRLRLDTNWKTRLQDLPPFINHLPRLSLVERSCASGSSLCAGLFDSAAGQEDDEILNLPSLQTFRSCSGEYEHGLRQDVPAASPSLRIEVLNATYRTLKELKRAGKLQAVFVLKVDEDEEQKFNAFKVDQLLFSTKYFEFAGFEGEYIQHYF